MNAMICRNCGAGLEADRIDTSLGMVTCSHCGGLHDIPRAGIGTDTTPESTSGTPIPRKQRSEVALPSRFKVRKGSGSMEVSWATGGLFPGLVLFLMASATVHMAVSSGMYFLLIASAGLYYLAAAKALNKHRIRVDSAHLQVAQGPLPWRGGRKLAASDIEQLYATEHTVRIQDQNSDNEQQSNTTRVRKHYGLSANSRKDGRVTILKGLHDPNQALWLEQELERLLGIADKHVTGSYTG